MAIKMPLVGGSCPLTGGKITGSLSFWHHAQIHLKYILKCILRWRRYNCWITYYFFLFLVFVPPMQES